MYRPQFYIINILFSLVHLLITPPYELIMTEFSKHKRDRQNWFSPPFYSGPRGYKMCLCVYHRFSWNTEYTSVCVYLMRGEYDDRLVWPFRGDITVQMVNQISDQRVHFDIFVHQSDLWREGHEWGYTTYFCSNGFWKHVYQGWLC